jgi:hypothetical protein
MKDKIKFRIEPYEREAVCRWLPLELICCIMMFFLLYRITGQNIFRTIKLLAFYILITVLYAANTLVRAYIDLLINKPITKKFKYNM